MKPSQKDLHIMACSLAGAITNILSLKKGLMLAARGGVAKTLQEFEKALKESVDEDWE